MAAENGRIVVGGQLLRQEDYSSVLEELAQFDPAQREAIEGYLIMQRAAAEAAQHRAQRGTADAEVDLGSFIEAGYDIAAVRNAIAARPWEHPADEATALQRTVHGIIGDRSQHYKDLELRLYKMHDALKGVAVDIKGADFAPYKNVGDYYANALVKLDLKKGKSSETRMDIYFYELYRNGDAHASPSRAYAITIARPLLTNEIISVYKSNEFIVSDINKL